MTVTDWYPDLNIQVTEGVVILTGSFENLDKKDWMVNLIEKTEGVIAYIDKTESNLPVASVLKPAQDEVTEIYTRTYKLLPYIASAILLLLIFLFFAGILKKLVATILRRRNTNTLLIRSVSSSVGILIVILGVYFSLKASGLSTLAVTLLGGTGMLGLGLGLALKSTFENYISSIMISLKELLKIGELVNISGHEGVVQSVTSRGTTLMDYDGNNIIIPNTEVFNSVIKNYTRNPNMRVHFTIGIGYDDSIDLAREVIMGVLDELSDSIILNPKPSVTVDSLGASTVNLKVYFWYVSSTTSRIKILSLVIQKTKVALMKNNVSMPDDAREVVFASPLKIENLGTEANAKISKEISKAHEVVDSNQDLSSELEDLKRQALNSPQAEKGENLI